MRFADGGRVVCTASIGAFRSTIRCWDVDTGKAIATTKGGAWTEIESAYRARRIVMSNYTTAAGMWNPLEG
ncbi:MAG: hypothetical protein LAP85_20940 [Acidobacteriia bacterium]|nr:hypothetical protein [Terriglobia bacterium]